MQKTDFYYELPEELIAQTPIEPRDSSRLLSVCRGTNEVLHTKFSQLPDLLREGDLLILNDSKVFPARLFGKKRGSLIDCELLLLSQKSHDVWETMVRPGRRLKKGAIIDFGGIMSAEIMDTLDGGNRMVRFDFDGIFFDLLEQIGQMPLPPYITEKLQNKARYNTIYSKDLGSAAAPTAGLHFTENVFDALSKKGVDRAFITLHVGLGTFRPVKVDDILDHHMHIEHYSIPDETVQKIEQCKARGGRVIAVGTTSCRTLESAAQNGKITAGSRSTDIFIYPGYNFRVIDGLITNFHLPESTLIMLVSAFLGRERTLETYHEAIKERYRFFSFGDSMMIL